MINYSDIKFPEKKIELDDRAVSIHLSSDNYKAGFNDALKLCESAVKEAEKKMVLPPMKKHENYPATVNLDWTSGFNIGWNEAIREIKNLNKKDN